MARRRNGLRWLLLIGLGGLGLLYLNSAAYSLWLASGGPPTPVPQAWLYVAAVRFGFALCLLLTGWLLFVGLASRRTVATGRLVRIWAITLLIALGLPQLVRAWHQDSCLDSGGRWDQGRFACQH